MSELQEEASGTEEISKEAENIRNEERVRMAVSIRTNIMNYSALEFSKIWSKVESTIQNIV